MNARQIVECDGIPLAWAEGFAALSTMPAPTGLSSARWQRIVDATGTFIDRWAARAIECGWTDLDVFGCDPVRPDARFDCMGVVIAARPLRDHRHRRARHRRSVPADRQPTALSAEGAAEQHSVVVAVVHAGGASSMSRSLLANGKPIRRSQLRTLRLRGEKISMGWAPSTARATDRLIKAPARRKAK